VKAHFLFCSLILFTAVVPAQPIDRIDPLLREKLNGMKDDEIAQMIIVLADQVDVNAMRRAFDAVHATKHERHYQAVTALQEKAAVTQGSLLGYLAGQRAFGRVESFESKWIVNMIFARASKGTILEMSTRSDIDRVTLMVRWCWMHLLMNRQPPRILALPRQT